MESVHRETSSRRLAKTISPIGLSQVKNTSSPVQVVGVDFVSWRIENFVLAVSVWIGRLPDKARRNGDDLHRVLWEGLGAALWGGLEFVIPVLPSCSSVLSGTD